MRITFPGGKRVRAEHRGLTIETDQPQAEGGEGSAPSPFDLFLASLATCAGYYVLVFCQGRDIPTDGIELTMETHRSPETKLIEQVEITVSLPRSFPDKYVGACVKSAERCTVKRHLQDPPKIHLSAVKSHD